ncbi:MAG TPA: ABC transporter permease [Thermoanaerobaculia bacterium]
MSTFYRLLLLLYPSAFRNEYGEELRAIFEERLRETSRLAAILGAIGDVVPNALAVHLDLLRQDVRFALRSFARAGGFTLTVISLVALGIGANTAAFSLADFVLLRALPYPDSDRLLRLWAGDATSQNEVSPADYRDVKAMATSSFRGMGAYASTAANLTGLGIPRRLAVARVTPELMPLVGTRPLLGSVITPANIRGADPAVLSHDLWQSQFHGDRAILGRVVRLDGTQHTIVGVMPPAFRFPSRETDLWTPLVLAGEDFEDRTDTYLHVVARLAPGATVEQARAELATIATRLARQYPDTNEEVRFWTVRLRDQIGRRSRLLLVALCGASLCILLLACANLAGLLLARGVSRARELSIRTALGAGRERLVRQLVTESLLLAIIGGAAGVLLAWASLPLLAQLVPTTLPLQQVPAIDLRVLLFAGVLMALTGLGFGVLPALRQPDRSQQRVRRALVVLEVTGSIVLLVSSGLLMRAIWRIEGVAPGFRSEGVTTLRTALPLPKYGPTAERQRFYTRVLDDVRALPGVTGAAYTTGLPMERTGGIWPVEVPGAPEEENGPASVRYVTPGYFATLGIPLRRGRDVAESDTTQRRPYVAVISESLAQDRWPGLDPIGRRFKIALDERVVIGVVGDVKVRGLERNNEPQVYLASPQVADNSIIGYMPQDLVIHSNLPAEQWLPRVRQIVAGADPEQPVSHVRALAEVVAGDTAPRRVQLRVLVILTAIALLIAGVGIHGLLSFAVSQRAKELGIRRALGAQTTGIVAMVLRDGLRLALFGAVAGLAIALLVGRSLRALLFGIDPADPQTFAAAIAICLLTAMAGSLRPALKAGLSDVVTALRE